jgi:hypothetical protein
MDKDYKRSITFVLREFFKDISVVAFGAITLSTTPSQLLLRLFSCILLLYSTIEIERYKKNHYGS